MYGIIAVLLIMMRRVIPFFIEKGIGQNVTVKNRQWIDVSSAIIFVFFTVAEVFSEFTTLSGLLAGILFILHSTRLYGWYNKAIFSKPLLWILYLGYSFITFGFGLFAVSDIFGLPSSLAIHALSVGGIGLISLGMMARVTLGHTGRNVFNPPNMLKIVFTLIVLAAVFRVVFPIINSAHYPLWILLSQVLWIFSFLIFSWRFVPMLIKSRIDNLYG